MTLSPPVKRCPFSGSGASSSAKHCPPTAMQKAAGIPAEYTRLHAPYIFIRGKANEKLGIVKALKAENRLVDFAPFRDYEAAKWVYQQGKRLNVTITEAAAKHIVSLAGTDIATLNNELTKAADYVGRGNELTREAIFACVTRSLEVRIFDMQDYLLSGKAQDGIRAYRQMLSDGESTFGIAGFMEKCFRSMLTARTYIDQGLNRERVLRLTGDKYPQKKLMRQLFATQGQR